MLFLYPNANYNDGRWSACVKTFINKISPKVSIEADPVILPMPIELLVELLSAFSLSVEAATTRETKKDE